MEVVAIEGVESHQGHSTVSGGTVATLVSMWTMLFLGLLGVMWTFTFPPAWALVKGESWAIDLWCLSGVAIIVAGSIASLFVRGYAGPLAVLAGAGVALFAALASDPNAQGPGFNFLAMLCDCWAIGCAIAILGRSDMSV